MTTSSVLISPLSSVSFTLFYYYIRRYSYHHSHVFGPDTFSLLLVLLLILLLYNKVFLPSLPCLLSWCLLSPPCYCPSPYSIIILEGILTIVPMSSVLIPSLSSLSLSLSFSLFYYYLISHAYHRSHVFYFDVFSLHLNLRVLLILLLYIIMRYDYHHVRVFFLDVFSLLLILLVHHVLL